MLFTYKNVVSDGEGNQVTVYQGFPISDVLDFELISFFNEADNTSQERMLVRLKTQVQSVIDKPKYNKGNVLVRTEKSLETIPVVHTINFKEDIEAFFGGELPKTLSTLCAEMHKTNRISVSPENNPVLTPVAELKEETVETE